MTRETILKRDTTKGIHHLFRARRIGSIVNIGLGLYQLYGGIQWVNSNAFANSLTKGTYFSDPASRSATFPTQILASLPGALIVGVGISKWIRFKKKKEIDLLAAYESGVPLRANIQRRLRGRHLISSTPAKTATIPDTLPDTLSVVEDTLISMSVTETDTSVKMPASRPEIMTVASILKGDTVRAIHRLFTSRRGGSTGNIILGVVTVAGGFALAAMVRGTSDAVSSIFSGFGSSSTRTPAHTTSPSGLSFSWPGVLITGVGIAKSARFSRREEQAVIDAYEQGMPLPIKIKGRLIPKYF